MRNSMLALMMFAGCFSACGDGGSIQGTPEYQAKKAEEVRAAAEGERSLFARFDEFTSMKAPLKEGKLTSPSSDAFVVLTKLPGSDWEMEGWKKEPDGSTRRCLDSAGCKGRHPLVTNDSFRAKSADQAKNLVRIDCAKGPRVMDIRQGTSGFGTVFAVDCLVEIFDLTNRIMIASKRFKADKVEEIGNTSVLSSQNILKPNPPATDHLVNPFAAIKEYLRTLGNI